MDQSTFLLWLPRILMSFLNIIPPHPAGLHSKTSIKPDVSYAGTLQGSKSQYHRSNFLVVSLLKHFLEPPQLIPNAAACLVSNLP